MKIGIAMTFSEGFSGGRLHAFLLGAELAAQGHDVTFVCNQPPGFLNKLPPVPGREQVKFEKLKFDLLRPPAPLRFDLWIIVHERSLNGRFFAPFFEHARRERVPILLLTFETPNWQSSMLWTFKPGWMDALIDEPARLGAQVLSSTQEGRRWAREYFAHLPAENFHVLSPPVTAGFYTEPVARDPQLILAFTRRSTPHKGYETILRLLNERLRGYRVVLVDGFGLSYEAANYVEYKRAHHGPEIDLRCNITDEEKYRLLKSARVLLYPSSFEGFGLPPGEALYWGTPVVCYDLPVLREIYGEALRYVPIGDAEAYEEAVHAELARTPDFTPAPAARSVGDFARWRADVARTLEAVLARATPPAPLPGPRGPATPPGVVIIDQLRNWNKEDTAAAAGLTIDRCAGVFFERDVYAQRKVERDARSMPGLETLLPPGTRDDDLRGRLLAAVESRDTPWVFLTEDLAVCPLETIAAAAEAAEAAAAVAAAIPVCWHFQTDGTRHYRTGAGELLAACGVFRRDAVLAALRATDAPGCRTQPIIDLSYLLLARGGHIVPAPGRAEILPPRTSPVEFDTLPAAEGSWQEVYRVARGAKPLPEPLPCRVPDDAAELRFLLWFREQMTTVLVQAVDKVASRRLMREMVDAVTEYCPLWRDAFDVQAPLRTFYRLNGGYVRYGRCFLTARHEQIFIYQALVALAAGRFDLPEEKCYHVHARELLALADETTLID